VNTVNSIEIIKYIISLRLMDQRLNRCD